jgi:hypothetical protein
VELLPIGSHRHLEILAALRSLTAVVTDALPPGMVDRVTAEPRRHGPPG